MPPQQKKRYVVLDALRGFAILGIILANFPEFSLWTFSDPSTWTRTDTVTRAVQTFFVDGKFYTLFSLLFGVGFSIQIANAGGKLRTFYRRMAVLLCIGLIHLFFLWSGHPQTIDDCGLPVLRSRGPGRHFRDAPRGPAGAGTMAHLRFVRHYGSQFRDLALRRP